LHWVAVSLLAATRAFGAARVRKFLLCSEVPSVRGRGERTEDPSQALDQADLLPQGRLGRRLA